jgi:hypothetical protein
MFPFRLLIEKGITFINFSFPLEDRLILLLIKALMKISIFFVALRFDETIS